MCGVAPLGAKPPGSPGKPTMPPAMPAGDSPVPLEGCPGTPPGMMSPRAGFPVPASEPGGGWKYMRARADPALTPSPSRTPDSNALPDRE